MVCPFCRQDTFIELATGRDSSVMGYENWSIKECLNCDYKVEDVIVDGRFVRLDHVITKPNKDKLSISPP